MNVIQIAFKILLVLAWFAAALFVNMLLSPLDSRTVIALLVALLMGASLGPIFGIRLVQD